MSIRLLYPLPGAGLTARFGWRPGFNEAGIHIPPMFHNGIDYGAPSGTVIRAAHAGRVTYVGWDISGGGWMVKINSARFATLYLHNLEKSQLVKAGDEVSAGQPIALVGMSGTATGPHLHFMLELNSTYIDPLPYLTSSKETKMLTPKQAQQLNSIFNAIFHGGNSMQDQKKSISQSLAEINLPVKRDGKLVPVRQDNADTNTLVRQALSEIADLRTELEAMKQ